MDQKKIGGFLKQLRRGKGITQEAFAQILGVSGRTVSRWETVLKVADYNSNEMQKLARRLSWLFLFGVASLLIYFILKQLGVEDTFLNGRAAECLLGFAEGVMLAGVLYTTGGLPDLRLLERDLRKETERINNPK